MESKFNKGSELDKQIYPEGEPTWGCKFGVLDVEDVKECFKEIEFELLKKYKMASMPIITLIKNKLGSRLICH